MNYQIDPYAGAIESFIRREFPTRLATGEELLDRVFNEIMGTKQHRYGPLPSPEAQVYFREVIRKKIAANVPIPIMSPWGSEKPDGSIVDVAEFSALKQLKCLHDRVSAHYEPGINVTLRIEDLSAPYQFYHRADEARREAALYTKSLINLVDALKLDFIRPMPDSGYGHSEAHFNALVEQIRPAVEAHLKDLQSEENFAVLKHLGWDKPIAVETINHYLYGYEKLYPNTTTDEKFHILARYFAAGLARKLLGHNAILPSWEGAWLELYFGKTPPGLDPSRYLRRIHYRTVPLSYTQNHIAPWRAKGYLLIEENGEVAPKLASYQDPFTFHYFQVNINDIIFNSDYLLA